MGESPRLAVSLLTEHGGALRAPPVIGTAGLGGGVGEALDSCHLNSASPSLALLGWAGVTVTSCQ